MQAIPKGNNPTENDPQEMQNQLTAIKNALTE
jgi:hypothetical protein